MISKASFGVDGIRQMVERARAQVVTQVNQALVLTYWHVGKIIKTEVLQHERAQYGAGLLKQLAVRLTPRIRQWIQPLGADAHGQVLRVPAR